MFVKKNQTEKKCWKAGVNNVLVAGLGYTAQLISPASETAHAKLVPYLSQLLPLFR